MTSLPGKVTGTVLWHGVKAEKSLDSATWTKEKDPSVYKSDRRVISEGM